MEKPLGEKIRFFRTLKNVSQLQLETDIGIAPGSISRFENNQINPTKETIVKIAKRLNLITAELMYLLDLNTEDPTSQEVEAIKNVVEPLFKKPYKFAYLLDNKSRILALSTGFKLIARLVHFDPNRIYNKNVAEVLFNPELGFRKFVKGEKFLETAKSVVAVLKQERRFLTHEPWWNELINRLLAYEDFKELWEDDRLESLNLMDPENRKLSLKVPGKRFNFEYSHSILNQDPRFMIVEYRKSTSS